jgi:hypothetical protein
MPQQLARISWYLWAFAGQKQESCKRVCNCFGRKYRIKLARTYAMVRLLRPVG